MTNESHKSENTQDEQPTTQVELTDEQLEQVVGGFEPNSPVSGEGDDIQKKWLPAN